VCRIMWMVRQDSSKLGYVPGQCFP
jgi:hypothetical protein